MLELDLGLKKLRVTFYSKNEKSASIAIAKYMEIEAKKDSKINAVLVSAKSLSALKKAYPNYFADIGTFIDKLLKYCKEQGYRCNEIVGRIINTNNNLC